MVNIKKNCKKYNKAERERERGDRNSNRERERVGQRARQVETEKEHGTVCYSYLYHCFFTKKNE